MEGKAGTNQTVLVARIAWLATFVVPLVLAGLLLAVKAAPASPAATTIVPLALDEEFELEEEGELEEGSCAEAEAEFEEGELSQGELDEICEEETDESRKKTAGPSAAAPEECVLRSAHANAVTPGKSNKLKLTIGYTTYEPVAATIQVGHLAKLHRHLSRSGVLRLVKSVPKSQPKRLVVSIQLAGARTAGCPFRRLVLFPR